MKPSLLYARQCVLFTGSRAWHGRFITLRGSPYLMPLKVGDIVLNESHLATDEAWRAIQASLQPGLTLETRLRKGCWTVVRRVEDEGPSG